MRKLVTGIDIVFESGVQNTGSGKCEGLKCGGKNNQYLTHPAFTFGTEELSGFWVG